MSNEGRFFTTLGQDTPTYLPGGATLQGGILNNVSAGTTDDILIYLTNELDEIFWAAGTDVPVDTTPGYAPGCMFIDRDVVAGTVKNYLNVGTALLCEFSIITVA